VDKKRRVYLIDASIYIFRAYFSLPATLTDSAGNPINALHGFAGFLAGFLEEAKPHYLAVAFDESLTTSFRNDIYPEYKANRASPPEDLTQQLGHCRTLVQALGLAGFSSGRYEADDLIGTLATRLRPRGFSSVIVSADKDLAQLIAPGDMFWDYARNRRLHYRDIPGWLGVKSGQVADYLALTGDAVDNIPGVPGIGPKTAAALLAHFGSLAELYHRLDSVAGLGLHGAVRIQHLLHAHHEQVMLARELTGIVTDMDMKAGIREVTRHRPGSAEVRAACAALGLGDNMQQRLVRAARIESEK